MLTLTTQNQRHKLIAINRSLENPARQLYGSALVDPARLTLSQDALREDAAVISGVHNAVKAALEQARGDKMLGSSLQCSVNIVVENSEVASVLERYLEELEAVFVVSLVEMNQPVPQSPTWAYEQEVEVRDTKVKVHVLPPKEDKCSRCWRYVAPSEDALCNRCEEVIGASPAA